MGKSAIFWIILVGFTLCMMEVSASVYFYQTQNNFSFASIQLWNRVEESLIQRGFLKPRTRGYYVSDDRYGWTLKENTSLVKDCWGRNINFSIGPNKERIIPKPKKTLGTILFLGGSFTVATCVDDTENFPYILATEYWKNWEVHNMAVSFWGTTHAYLRLTDALKGGMSPSLVIYGMIPHHIKRNYLDKSYLLATAKSSRKVPHFELIDGELVFQGTVGPSAGMKDGHRLGMKENEITSAYLLAMKKMCDEKGIKFGVVFLPPDSKYPLSVINTLSQFNIPWLNLTDMEYEGLNEGKDKHPSPKDHRGIAMGIAKSFFSDILVSLEKASK